MAITLSTTAPLSSRTIYRENHTPLLLPCPTSISPTYHHHHQTFSNLSVNSSNYRRFHCLQVANKSTGNTIEIASEGIAKALDEVQVYDLTGRAVTLTDLWKDRKAVIAFARHFGCVLCRKRADLLASKKDVMDAAGVALVLIGPGNIDQAKAFVERTNFKGEVYADPTQSCYKALDFAYGVTTTFTPKAGLKIIQLYMEGYRQDWELSFQKDTVTKGGWQQGGILVAGPGVNNISYIHKDKEAGDDPDVEEVIQACCSN